MTIYTVFQWCDNADLGHESSLIGVFSDLEKAEKCKEMVEAQIKEDVPEQQDMYQEIDYSIGSPYNIEIEAYTINRFVYGHHTDNTKVFDLNDDGALRDIEAVFISDEERI